MTSRENPTPTDDQLVDDYLADPRGAEGLRAADELFSRYHARVFQWCRGYAQDPDDALDLAQEVMINAFGGLERFDRCSRFSSWLYAVTRNRCLTAVRGGKRRTESLERIPEPASGMVNIEEDLQQRQEEKALRIMMGSHLAPREEEAFWLRVVEKMSVEQITRVLHLDNATGARAILQKARRKLRRVWGDRMDEFEGVD